MLQNKAEPAEQMHKQAASHVENTELLLQQAITCHRQGNRAQAESLYKKILQEEPRHFDALNLLGVLALECGHPIVAVDLISKALEISPNQANAHSNLGNALRILGRYDESLRSCERALQLNPYLIEALNNLGNALHFLSRHEEALAAYDRALSVQPDYIDAINNHGSVLQVLGRYDEALRSYDALIKLKPDYVSALVNRANVLTKLNRHEEALANHDQALQIDPGYVDGLFNRAIPLRELGRNQEALACYDRVLELNPHHVDALINRGTTFRNLGLQEAALASYERALQIKPDHHVALNNRGNTLKDLNRHEEALNSYDLALKAKSDYTAAINNRGGALRELGRHEEALLCYDEALKLEPDYIEAFINRATSLRDLSRLQEARAYYERAIEIEPENVLAHFYQSLCSLALGDYDEGWKQHEWRLKTDYYKRTMRRYPEPIWDGNRALNGKTILLRSEQGLGDTIQFCRYAKLVAGLNATVLLEVQPPLKILLTGLEGVAGVYAEGEALPPFDLQCPLLSVPERLQTGLMSVPADVPYLWANKDLIQKLSDELRDSDGLRIGLCWKGSTAYVSDKDRTPGLGPFRALFDIPRAQFFTLLPSSRKEFAEAGGMDIGRELDEVTAPFEETAALIMNLDLVITCDTSIGHLAAALGKPVWIVLPFSPDWRWMLNREDSPWYPNVRLFRQAKRGDWTELFTRVENQLKEVIASTSLGRQVGHEFKSGVVQAPVSIGELLDKITILEIKNQRISDTKKLENVAKELAVLNAVVAQSVSVDASVGKLIADLRLVNTTIWDVEDAIRECEARKDFGPAFVDLARSVYKNNDRRAQLKKQINEMTCSELVEEKSYARYV